MSNNSIGDRIKLIRKHFDFTQSELAMHLGLDPQRMQNLESGRVKNLSAEETCLFEIKLKVSGWWVFTGIGEMLLSSDSNVQTLYTNNEHLIKIIPGSQEQKMLCVDTDFFRNNKTSYSMLRAIKMIGDSMQPTLQNGDWLIVDTSKIASINGLYVVMINEEFFIHRLTFLHDGTIELSSDNLAYKSQTINKETIQIIGIATLIIKNC